MVKVSGTVYRSGSKERIKSASIKAATATQVEYTTTDANGNFSCDLNPGKWTLVALHEDSFPSKPRELDLMQDMTDIRIDLYRLQGTEDEKQGRPFWYSLLIALGALIIIYAVLHLIYRPQPVPIMATLPTLITQAQEQVEKASDAEVSAGLLATIGEIKAGVAIALADSDDLNAADEQAVSQLIDDIEAAAKDRRIDDVQAGLITLGQVLQTPSRPAVGLWDRDPWRFLEVFMWGLAGVLVYKIITIGWYLRSQRFYREGIVMHISHIITTPLLVLVAVLLLSLASLSISLANGNQLTLDLSDPRIMVAVSFLLGTSPWPLWGFIENTAKRITGQGG